MKKKLMIVLCSVMFVLSGCGKDEAEENVVHGLIKEDIEISTEEENIEDDKSMADTENADHTSDTAQTTQTELMYEGSYADSDINEPMLFIQKKEDGTYAIQIGIYRLIQLDDCIGVNTGKGLEFSTMEWGEGQEITGTLTLNGDVATVILSAPWSDTFFKDVNEYRYHKISDQSKLPGVENTAETIQDEIAGIEKRSQEHNDIDSTYMSQLDMNIHSAEWYQLWDEELNSLWSRLSEELDPETKEKVLEEQRAWIKRKEENVRAAGMWALGGTLQPLLESDMAGGMTRARVYVLAGYLAEVRNEEFIISPEIQESLDIADPSLNDVFEKFQGQWIFDDSRGACVGVERTENCAYGVEGSTWTVWVTGGDILSDLDVYGYTGSNILFNVVHDGQDAFYELSLNMEDSVNLAYGTSLDAMDDVIVCEK